jgi:hypothetical protein
MARKPKRGSDPSGLPRLAVNFEPYTTHTVVTVVLSSRSGPHRFDDRVARWHLHLTRADLAGHSTTDVLITCLGMVVQRLEQCRSDPADWHAGTTGSDTAVGLGAPASGATGAVQDRQPWVQPTLNLGLSVDSV